MVDTHPTSVRFRAAVEARDVEAVMALTAPEVVMHSPTLHRPFTGAATVRRVLSAVLRVVEDITYVSELSGTSTHGLVFDGRVGALHLQGVDLLTLDEQGRIVDLTVLVRPLSGLVALKDAMTAALPAYGEPSK